MGELLAVLAVLGLAMLVVASPILTIFVLLRARGLERRVERLERERREAQAAAGTQARPETAPQVAATSPPPFAVRSPEPAPLASPPPRRVEAPTPEPVRPRASAPAAGRTLVTPPKPRAPRIAWEQWIGVRGAAVLGGVVLALAAILLVKVAFERQWIGGAMRCWLGAAAGAGAIAAAAVLRKRDVRVVPNALDGAGVVALFAATWAAHRVWGFFSAPVALVLLSAVTAIASALALRHRSQLIAVLGLVGGFAAAFLLSERGESPLGLFGYLLLLDLALLFVGRRGGWPSLGMLALLGTFAYEALHLMVDLDPERLLLATGILAVFALVFVVGAAPRGGAKTSRGWIASRAGAVLLPFLIALRFAAGTRFEAHVGATYGLVVILGVAACVIARAQRTPWLALGAATGGASVLAVWTLEVGAAGAEPWKLAAFVGGLALLYQVFAELDRKTGAPAAAIAAGCGLLLVVAAPVVGRETSALAWTVALAVPSAALVRQGAWRGREALGPIAGALAGFGVLSHGLTRIADPDGALPPPAFPALGVVAGALVAGAAALHAVALVLERRMRARGDAAGDEHGRAGTFALHAAGLFVAIGSFGLTARLDDVPLLAAHVAVLLPAALLAAAAARLGSAFWTLVGALIVAGLQMSIAWHDEGMHPGSTLPGSAAGMLTFAAIPLLVALLERRESASLRRSRALWIAAALSLAPCLPLVHGLYVERFGDRWIATPYVVLGAVVTALAVGVARALAGSPAFASARASYAAAAAVLLATALPVQVDVEWPAVALAFSALALSVLARRLPARPLADVAASAAIAATLLLIAAALDPRHYARSPVPIASWLSYAHLAPAAALVGGAWLLRGAPRARAALGFGAVVIGFAWINLSILDLFSAPETRLSFAAERLQTRDLATSLAWAVYALGLLVAGTALRAGPLRWASLGLLLLTIAKVFLFDLGGLDGLLRVASLAGLALSLIAVSLFYQRFVFRRPLAEAS